MLAYTHFSALMRPDRHLAAATGVNIDGATLFDLKRAGIDWLLDPRPMSRPAPLCTPNDDLDRGHLVRRRDPC